VSITEREDYLLRQIKAVGVMLARIMGLRVRGQVEEAAAELERAYGLLLGPQRELIRMVDPPSAGTDPAS
jgi:hypothetical protein